MSAAQVKELRERTGAGIMECKKALEISQGNLEKAIEELRKLGKTKADKKSGRIAAEGGIVIETDGKRAVMLEINSETDFVARDKNFVDFVTFVAQKALQNYQMDVETLLKQPFDGHHSIEEMRQELVAKVGENVQIRRIIYSHQDIPTIGTYLHGNRIGVIVEMDVDNPDLARDIAMHIAASRPMVIAPEDIAQEIIDKEKEIYLAQAAGSGKPQDIIEKMVLGRLKKYLDEVSLLGQPFVKDPDITVGTLLNKARAKVTAFYRFEVGEGIEKAQEDFKEAVMSQVQSG